MEYKKVKSVAKQVVARGERLNKTVLHTLKQISDIVGSTLGPGGRQVLIERFESGLPPKVTKDGVTVYRSIGFRDGAMQSIMEAARDASVRTASEAGDGTTTATILSESIVRRTSAFCEQNPHYSPQKVVRRLENLFKTVIEPTVKKLSIQVDSTTEEGQKLMHDVARISANGDVALADAVIKCYEIVGDNGNVTIAEMSGSSDYQVEKINGYPIGIGYEECCQRFMPKFINDPGTQTCRMESPVFVLYHGTLNEVQTAYSLLAKVGDKFQELIEGRQVEGEEYRHHNVVFVAIGFSEAVLGAFAAGWAVSNALKIFPLVVPKSPVHNGQIQFLDDLAAVTGANVFDPMNKPLDHGELEDLGPGVDAFEATRFRSTILGKASQHGTYWEDRLEEQVNVVETMLLNPGSELDKILLDERLGKLTGGIAKLKVIGSSNGELKEKRDRAEDAVCAVRGALKGGCLPGGGWTLLKLMHELGIEHGSDPVVNQILQPALEEPVLRLLQNCGFNAEEVDDTVEQLKAGIYRHDFLVYDANDQVFGDPMTLGLLDSQGAVLEALRNSISIASLLGSLGGWIVFERDDAFERSEASDTAEWLRNVNDNPADNRA